MQSIYFKIQSILDQKPTNQWDVWVTKNIPNLMQWRNMSHNYSHSVWSIYNRSTHTSSNTYFNLKLIFEFLTKYYFNRRVCFAIYLNRIDLIEKPTWTNAIWEKFSFSWTKCILRCNQEIVLFVVLHQLVCTI